MSQKFEQKFERTITTNSDRVLEQGITFSNRVTPIPTHVTEIPGTGYWFDPVTGQFHKEESLLDVKDDVPRVTHEILNIYEQQESERLRQSGNSVMGNGGWTDEYYPKAYLVNEEVKAARKSGNRKTVFTILDGLRQSGKITSDDFANVKSAVLASKVMGISPISHVLKQLITTNRVNRIDQKYYKFNAADNQIQDMGYFNIPEGTIGAYESDTAAIAPYGYSWGVTEDYFMQPYDVNPLQDNTSLFGSRLDLFENKKIAAALNLLAVDTGGASLTAKSAEGVYTNNGYDIIFNKISAIGLLERANPTTIITQRKTLVDYLKNQQGLFENTFNTIGPAGPFSGIVSGVTNLGGMRWGYDNLITLNTMIILDPEWFIYNEGPQRLSTVVNNLTNVRQTMFKKWGAFKIVTFGITAAGSQESFRKIDTLA